MGLPLPSLFLVLLLLLAIAHSSVHAFEPRLTDECPPLSNQRGEEESLSVNSLTRTGDMWSTAGETANNLGEPVYFVIVDLRDRITALEKIVAAQGAATSALLEMNKMQDAEISALREESMAHDAEISALSREISELRAEMSAWRERNAVRDAERSAWHERVTVWDAEISELRELIRKHLDRKEML